VQVSKIRRTGYIDEGICGGGKCALNSHSREERLMSNATKVLLSAVLSFLSLDCFGQAADCSAFLTKPVFTSQTIDSSESVKTDFRLLQCAADWHSSQEAQSAGISLTVPIYGMPVPIDANWDQKKVQQWKSENCSDSERKGDYATRLHTSVYSIDPVSAKAALACFQARFSAEGPRALRCLLTETQTALLFQAEWRRSPGESDNPPIVTGFTAINTDCQNAGALGPQKAVLEGGVSLLCTVQEKAAAFSLNTTRGQCSVSAVARLPKIVLSSMTLTGPTFIPGQDVEIPAGVRIVTNGFPLTIRADRLTLGGSATIVSFESTSPVEQKAGRYASAITITAQDVRGQGVAILNAGEPGGPGVKGATGSPGGAGAPGKGRDPLFNRCGPLQFACNLMLLGCTGGEDGGPGGQGLQGFPGNPGAPGGGAGDVTIDVPFEARSAFGVYTNVSLAGTPQDCGGRICGGLGGPGGPGGDGGIGGAGGPGARGSTWCGGTNNGPDGPRGQVGPAGANGKDGEHASVRFQ
jgi:hypothetical protein